MCHLKFAFGKRYDQFAVPEKITNDAQRIDESPDGNSRGAGIDDSAHVLTRNPR